MNMAYPLAAVLVLSLAAYLGAETAGLKILFGTILPYFAIAIFVFGFVYRVVEWAKSPVPFRIPTTCGQQRSLPWIKRSRLDNPSTALGVVGRMALETIFFRSLFRNTKTELLEGPRVVHGSSYWLWFFSLAFHWSLFIILARHLRFFTEPVPSFVILLQNADGFLRAGAPTVYISTFMFLVGLTFLLSRRALTDRLRYISLASDYFPLFLSIGIGVTGVLMRHFVKTDVVAVKELALGLVSFRPVDPEGIHYLFYVHLFLVSCLLAYIPFSKLMHMAGVFLSPTRNLANDSREKRHVNPWNPEVRVHTYEEYEDEFRDKMKAAGIPVEKE